MLSGNFGFDPKLPVLLVLLVLFLTRNPTKKGVSTFYFNLFFVIILLNHLRSKLL